MFFLGRREKIRERKLLTLLPLLTFHPSSLEKKKKKNYDSSVEKPGRLQPQAPCRWRRGGAHYALRQGEERQRGGRRQGRGLTGGISAPLTSHRPLTTTATSLTSPSKLKNLKKKKKKLRHHPYEQAVSLPVLIDAYGAQFVDIRRLQPETGICTYDDGFSSTG